MLSTLKDRKFLAGLAVGIALAGSVAVLQPLNAAPAASSQDQYLKAIAGAMAKMMSSQTAMQKDLSEIKASAAGINQGVRELKETTFNPSTTQPR